MNVISQQIGQPRRHYKFLDVYNELRSNHEQTGNLITGNEIGLVINKIKKKSQDQIPSQGTSSKHERITNTYPQIIQKI